MHFSWDIFWNVESQFLWDGGSSFLRYRRLAHTSAYALAHQLTFDLFKVPRGSHQQHGRMGDGMDPRFMQFIWMKVRLWNKITLQKSCMIRNIVATFMVLASVWLLMGPGEVYILVSSLAAHDSSDWIVRLYIKPILINLDLMLSA